MSAVPGQDMVVLEIADGPTLTLHPESARDLMLAQGKARKRSGTNGKPAPLPGETEVPVELRWEGLEEGVVARGATRGFLGRVLLKAVHLVTGDRAVDATVEKVVERVDAQVVAGVYQLGPDALPELKKSGPPLTAVPAAKGDDPILVLIHGTFSTTQGTFGKLWAEHPDLVKALFAHYGGRVYALDHPTLGKSPDRQRADPRREPAQGRASSSGDPFARRIGRRGAGSRLREAGRRRPRSWGCSRVETTQPIAGISRRSLR